MAAINTRRALNNISQDHAGRNLLKKDGVAGKSTRSVFGELNGAKMEGKGEIKKPALRQRNTNLRKGALLKNSGVTEVQKPVNNAAELPVPMEMGTPAIEKVPEKALTTVEDIDKEDAENPQLCSLYVNDIYKYMLYLESAFPIKKNYLKDSGLKPKMRSILVDWLFQVHQRFQLLQETAYLTVAILDRFLELKPVPRTKLQLAGVTAMLIASKYEEMYAPEVVDFVYITDKAFTKAQILTMEVLMLRTLNFDLGRPLPLHFLRRNSKAGEVDATQHALAKYLMELALLDYNMCHVSPSRLAAAALCLSLKILENRKWSDTLEYYSTYSEKDLTPIMCHLANNLSQASTNQYVKSIRSKYSSQKCMKIALTPELKTCETIAELAAEAPNHEL